MKNIPKEKHPIDAEGTAEGLSHKGKAISEPNHNGIYLDYGPLLPDSYNQDIIVALIRDPECIFCYWELSGTAITTTLGNTIEPNLKWILRVHTLRYETPAHKGEARQRRQESSPVRDNLSQKSFNDIVLAIPQNYSNIQGNYYLTALPDTKYQLELGVFRADNEFISLVKSSIVTTPRRNKAPMTDTTSYIR